MKGRVLIDIPRLKLKSGEYADIDDIEAKALVADGAFDPRAPWPREIEVAAVAAPETAAMKRPKFKGGK